MMPTFEPVAMRSIVLNRANKLAANSNFYVDGFEAHKMGNLVQAIFETIQETGDSEMTTELESLRKENAAQLVAIEDMQRIIDDIANYPHKTNWIIDWCDEALAPSKYVQSTERLERRDRKRDAKLLRACVDSECCPKDFKNIMQAIANQRESGEWIPEL